MLTLAHVFVINIWETDTSTPLLHMFIHELGHKYFFSSCSHILLLSPEPGWTQLLPSEGAQRKSSQAANCLAGLCICSAESKADDVTEQMCVFARVCVLGCTNLCLDTSHQY